MRRLLKQTLASLFLLSGCTPAQRPNDIRNWAVYYSDEKPASDFKSLDLVVFDRIHHPKIDELKQHTIVLGYVSAGEVYDYAPEKEQLIKENAILFQNPLWKSHVVAMDSPLWHELVLGYVNDVVKQGFDGVMLDTIESPLAWAKAKSPERLEAMKEGSIRLIHEIRLAYPGIRIMVNRPFAILPEIAPDIDYVLAESILSDTNVSTGQSVLFPPHSFGEVARQLHEAIAIAPKLEVFTLDYWKQDDVNGLARIYSIQRAHGFIPYVTTPDLTRYTPEPAPPSRVHHR